MRILIVDDTMLDLQFGLHQLRHEHEVHVASNDAQALELINNLEFDAVLTDLYMPPANTTEKFNEPLGDVIADAAITKSVPYVAILSRREGHDVDVISTNLDVSTKLDFSEEIQRIGESLCFKTDSDKFMTLPSDQDLIIAIVMASYFEQFKSREMADDYYRNVLSDEATTKGDLALSLVGAFKTGQKYSRPLKNWKALLDHVVKNDPDLSLQQVPDTVVPEIK
jgi:CheY-like chemotaxis protein